MFLAKPLAMKFSVYLSEILFPNVDIVNIIGIATFHTLLKCKFTFVAFWELISFPFSFSF